jgi:hypothetical protein
MITTPSRVGSCFIAAACALLAPAVGAEESPAWQPFRTEIIALEPAASVADSTPLVGVPVDAPAGVPLTQSPFEPALVCPEPVFAAPAASIPVYVSAPAGGPTTSAFWQWRSLPEGVVWQSYWSGVHEPRIAGVPFFDQNGTALLDVALGGRVSLLRYGTDGPSRPMGAELQIEGAAFPRLNLDQNWDLDATDFRFGLPLVYGRERWEAKFSYYHLSSHMGDEFAVRNPGAIDSRINFSRDALVAALAFYPLPAWRWYAETGWAFHYDGGSEPWEFQFGVDVAEPGPTDFLGAPFVSVNGHLREEHDFGGNVVLQAGWLWRGNTTRTLRLGFHYFNGKTNQFEFFDQFEEQLGGGVWYDF